MIKLVECPRDAMQGIERFIPTKVKIDYINLLLKVGFDTIDFGSFVSEKAIPQMRDTAEVLSKLDMSNGKSRLLAIVANLRGAEEACSFHEISFLGYPMSISETFQQRNTNKSIGESLSILQEIQELCVKSNKKLVTYLSMGFGNPYGDPYDEDIVLKFADILVSLDIKIISLADTIGTSTPGTIQKLFNSLESEFTEVEFGVHLHSQSHQAKEKIEAAYLAGCKRFDGAIMGFGGCPMAEDELVGNIATEQILSVLEEFGQDIGIDRKMFDKSLIKASEVFA